MISAIRQRFPVARRESHRLGRGVCYLLLFVFLLALVGQAGSWVNAAPVHQTVPGGTIPPGGTLPPPTPPAAGTGFVRVLHLAPFAKNAEKHLCLLCASAVNESVAQPSLLYTVRENCGWRSVCLFR